ncbi:MAG: hypothetical protein ACP5U0_09720 [Caldisphaera sp.]
MEEPAVVSAVRRYLSENGWHLINNVSGELLGERFIPDIVASKRGKLLSVECKGSIGLEDIAKGIGQCIEHQYYGSNFIYFAVPEDISEQALMMVKNIILLGGKIGLLKVKRNRKVEVILNPKELKLTRELKIMGEKRKQKLAFVRDLRIDELGKILDFALRYKGKYRNKKELEKILLKNKNKIFVGRKSISMKSVLNALITPSNLGLIDGFGNLTEEGEALRELYISDRGKYKEALAAYLLINGNWIELLQIVEEGRLKMREKLATLAELLEKHKLIDESMDKMDYAKRISSQYFKWLADLGIIKREKDNLYIDWPYVIQILSGKLNLNI